MVRSTGSLSCIFRDCHQTHDLYNYPCLTHSAMSSEESLRFKSVWFHISTFQFCMVPCTSWGSGIRGLTRGLATLPQGYQEPLIVKTRTEDPRWAWGEQIHAMQYFSPSVLWHCWLGDRKGIRPVNSCMCWFVGGDDLTGALYVFQLQLSSLLQ